jgi:hypothetical protein
MLEWGHAPRRGRTTVGLEGINWMMSVERRAELDRELERMALARELRAVRRASARQDRSDTLAPITAMRRRLGRALGLTAPATDCVACAA